MTVMTSLRCAGLDHGIGQQEATFITDFLKLACPQRADFFQPVGFLCSAYNCSGFIEMINASHFFQAP